ncbi:hypothetical protein G7B40_009445, partial [Aetokthonos hydrillicola Thurmond2011]
LKTDSHALLTRPPLTPKGPFDLHVLSIPPAFILSQDQTLRFDSGVEVNLLLSLADLLNPQPRFSFS